MEAVEQLQLGRCAQVASRLGEFEAGEIFELAEESFSSGETHLVVDLASVQVLDSVVLERFADIQDAAVRLGGWLKLAHAGSLVQDILRITSFTDYVTLIDAPGTETVGMATVDAAPAAPVINAFANR